MDMVLSYYAEKFDYFDFSDQDDLWLPDKLMAAVKAISDSKAVKDHAYSFVASQLVEGYGG